MRTNREKQFPSKLMKPLHSRPIGFDEDGLKAGWC